MDFEGECNTRKAFVFQLKRKRGKGYFNAESNSRFPGGLVWKPKKKSE